MVPLLATLRAGESAMLDGFALVVTFEGSEVWSKRLPPEPVIPPLPKRTTVKVRRPRVDAEVVDAAFEVVS